MKKTVLLLFYCFTLALCGYSQSSDDCETMYKSAIEYFEKGDINKALARFNRVKNKCGEYRGVSNKIKECDSILNKSKTKFTIGKKNISFGPQGGEESVLIKSDGAWTYGKAKVPEWLSLSKNKDQLVIECESNTSGEDRDGKITLIFGEGDNKVYRSIRVSQSSSSLSVSTSSLSFPEGGSTYRIRVSSNDSWYADIQNCTWISVKKESDGVLVSCSENPFTMERHGNMSIVTSNNEAITIDVTQDPSEATLELEASAIKVKWNTGGRTVEIITNDPDWTAERIRGGSWCRPVKQNDHTLMLNMEDNETGYEREVMISVTAGNVKKDLIVTQRSSGYGALYDDYFLNMGGAKKTTKYSASVYGLGSWGVRASALMTRWRVVEIDLLNVNASFSKSFLLSWEPMVRGYLPLQSEGRAWTPYVGVGGCVHIIDTPLKDGNKLEHSRMVLEAGAEFNMKLKDYDNISSRVFFRIDGYFSIGVAFDMYEWK